MNSVRSQPEPRFQRTAHLLDSIAGAIAFVGKVASWLIIPIIVAVLLSVLGGVLRITQFADWNGEIFLFGDGITLNSLLELQWHLFGVLLMLTGAYALYENRHVRVDVLSERFSPRVARLTEIAGDLIFLLPLCIILIDRSWPLLELSYNSGERSNEDGLTHRWVIKMFVPIGFALLAAFGLTRVIRNVLILFGAPPAKAPRSAKERPRGG